MSSTYDHASDDAWKAKYDPDRAANEDFWTHEPPTKPGWYWKRCTINPERPSAPFTVEVLRDKGTLRERNLAVDALLKPSSHYQWDPTPILGPGELAKMGEDAYKEGYSDCQLDCGPQGRGYDLEHGWRDSRANDRVTPKPE